MLQADIRQFLLRWQHFRLNLVPFNTQQFTWSHGLRIRKRVICWPLKDQSGFFSWLPTVFFNQCVTLGNDKFYHMTRTAPRALSLQNYWESPYEGRTRWREQGRKKPSGPARIAYGPHTGILSIAHARCELKQLSCCINPDCSVKMSNVSEHSELYNNPSYSSILIGSHLWSIRGQTHRWRQRSIQVFFNFLNFEFEPITILC